MVKLHIFLHHKRKHMHFVCCGGVNNMLHFLLHFAVCTVGCSMDLATHYRHPTGCMTSQVAHFLAMCLVLLSPMRTKPIKHKLMKVMFLPNLLHLGKIHPKLHDINLHNTTHSLISWNPRERMFVVQISLLIVIFFSLISRVFFIINANHQRSQPTPSHAPHVNTGSVTFLFLFFFFFLCHLLNVGACICHIARDDQVECTTPT